MKRRPEPLLCELHAHTTWSDGELSLRALVDLYAAARPDIARRFGVTLSDELMEQVRGRIMAGD
jgi:hypothetical protein